MKWVVLLRGINLGGLNTLKMADLKLLLAEMGFKNVLTYIQSGNIVFEDSNNDVHAALISDAIYERFSLRIPVLCILASSFKQIVTSNPYAEKYEDLALHVTFLGTDPIITDVHLSFDNDSAEITKEAVYLHIPEAYHKTKLSNAFLEKNLKTTCTTRNMNTCRAIVGLI